jgi:membrane-associated phospholipid phosphatase
MAYVSAVRRPLIPDRNRSSALALAVLAWIVTALMGLHYSDDSRPGRVDRAVDGRIVAELAKNERLVQHLVSVGNPAVITLISLVLVAVLALLRRPRAALLAALSPPLAGALTEWVIKPLVGRTFAGGLAFPSGHTTGIFTVAFVIVVVVSERKPPKLPRALGVVLAVGALGLAVSVAAALVAARYHYATDTVGGAGVALAVVLSVSVAVDAVSDARTARRVSPVVTSPP